MSTLPETPPTMLELACMTAVPGGVLRFSRLTEGEPSGGAHMVVREERLVSGPDGLARGGDTRKS